MTPTTCTLDDFNQIFGDIPHPGRTLPPALRTSP